MGALTGKDLEEAKLYSAFKNVPQIIDSDLPVNFDVFSFSLLFLFLFFFSFLLIYFCHYQNSQLSISKYKM